jgi:hypothetical protein
MPVGVLPLPGNSSGEATDRDATGARWCAYDDVATACLLLPPLAVVGVAISPAVAFVVVAGAAGAHIARSVFGGEGSLAVTATSFFLAVTLQWVSSAGFAAQSGGAVGLPLGLAATALLVLLAAWALLHEDWLAADAPEFGRLLGALLRGCAPATCAAFLAWAATASAAAGPRAMPWVAAAVWAAAGALWPAEKGTTLSALRTAVAVAQPSLVRLAMRGVPSAPRDAAEALSLIALALAPAVPRLPWAGARGPFAGIACFCALQVLPSPLVSLLGADGGGGGGVAGSIAAPAWSVMASGVLSLGAGVGAARDDAPAWARAAAAVAVVTTLWVLCVGLVPLLLPVPLLFAAAAAAVATAPRGRASLWHGAAGGAAALSTGCCIAARLASGAVVVGAGPGIAGAVGVSAAGAVGVVLLSGARARSSSGSGGGGCGFPVAQAFARGGGAGTRLVAALYEGAVCTAAVGVACAELLACAAGGAEYYPPPFVALTSASLACAFASGEWTRRAGPLRTALRVLTLAAICGKLALLYPAGSVLGHRGACDAAGARGAAYCIALLAALAAPAAAFPAAAANPGLRVEARGVGGDGATEWHRRSALLLVCLCVASGCSVAAGVHAGALSSAAAAAAWLVSTAVGGARAMPHSVAVARSAAAAVVCALLVVLLLRDGLLAPAPALWALVLALGAAPLGLLAARRTDGGGPAHVLVRVLCAAGAGAAITAAACAAAAPACLPCALLVPVGGVVGASLGAAAHDEAMRRVGGGAAASALAYAA